MSRDALKKLEQAADALAQARQRREPCAQISATFGITTLTEAYAVQEINTRRALDQGRRLVGRKVGLTSTAVQQQLGVDQPDFGMLFADMEIADGEGVDCSRLIQPKAEGEIAFVLGRDLPDADTTLAELMSAVEYLLPAIEIVDSAIVDWRITLADTVADNASSALYVLGKQPTRLSALDLRLEGMLLEKNRRQASIGVGAACLGNPLDACLWLARTMAEFGRPLVAGDVLLSGALGPMTQVVPGDHLHLRLTRLGEVGCHFH
ncbi:MULTISPECIES: fumarylacetoacetate hydrolase family protein [unclassified Pseudomonas]|uniref:2-keto-4-pentenoate hydratase n=1 Tax=unclassified Pseudomonas TaxID=196821 RepID=UPI0024489469|nr:MULTISPECIES: fumarylacetoacetate hydrolase family protein [unclassified Pseudomonas]MDH0893055.1 fumarylacetoacetate hydrolase family protein [Pseudomonas sp. GD03875]MDH1066186.1 fumarylacetoacetate hydrolase family protein [Pseudomonas sp. GD03985]